MRRYAHEGWAGTHYESVTELAEDTSGEAVWDFSHLPTDHAKATATYLMGNYRNMIEGGTRGSWQPVSLQDVRRFITEGWMDGANRMRDKTKTKLKATTKMKNTRRVRCRDNFKGNVDLNRILHGRTNDLFTRRKREHSTESPVLSLIIPMGGHCMRSQEQMFWTGAAGLLLAQRLEAAGFSVELVAAFAISTTGRSDQGSLISVTMKKSSEMMRIGTLAALTALGSTFRTVGFISMIKSQHIAKHTRFGGELGYPKDLVTLPKLYKDHPIWRKGAIVLPNLRGETEARRYLDNKTAELEKVS